jgi:hypothetical protein
MKRNLTQQNFTSFNMSHIITMYYLIQSHVTTHPLLLSYYKHTKMSYRQQGNLVQVFRGGSLEQAKYCVQQVNHVMHIQMHG